MHNDSTKTLLSLNQELLDAIAAGDWPTYAGLCDPSISAIESEAMGHVVTGLNFHHFYFQLGGGASVKPRNTMCDPHVRVMGDVAVLAYFRLTQYVDGQGHAHSRGTEETRVWQRIDGVWKHVHFHRSAVS